jgi:Ig-like domain from next to BRCA1 gene/Domain of unknown function (DUF4214)
MNRILPAAVAAAFSLTLWLGLSASPALCAATNQQNTAYVSALYRDVLQRSAGYDGLNAWVPGLDNGSKTFAEVARSFITSTEYHQIRVRDMFSAYLHRGIDDYSLSNYVKSGGSLRSMRISILTSQEYYSLHGSNGQGYVTALYQDLLGRTPRYGDAQTWVNMMNNGHSRADVASGIYASPEGYGRVIDSLYGAFLKRAADAPGKAQNLQMMERGVTEEDIAVGLLTSAEYVNRVQAGNGNGYNGGYNGGQPPFGGNNNNNNQYNQRDSAQFVGQNVPASMVSGQSYYISVTLRNTGSTQWDPNTYVLSVYPDGTPTWSVLAVTLPAPVNPGNAVTFTFNVIAPQSPGQYDFRWQLRRNGVGFFGDVTQDAQITVNAARSY